MSQDAGLAGSGADWSRAPKVSKDIEGDFGKRDEEPYEGESEAVARQVFQQHDLDWDALTPQEFAQAILSLRQDQETSDSLGPACFLFCDRKIPKIYQRNWIMAVWAARDVHEDD
jgi:hypothetical protein